MPGSILVVCYDNTTGRYLVQRAGSAQIADEAIISAKIASGAIGTPHLANQAVTSAKIASGVVGTPHILDESITSAKLASGAVIGDRVADAGIFSGKLASGSIGVAELLANAIITSAKIASGQVGIPHIYPGAVISAKIGANVIATPHILNQGILSASIGALAVGTPHIANQAVTSAKIASGIIGGPLLQDLGILSGKYASGSITEQALVSGISIDISEISQEPNYRAGELVSAYQGIQFSTSGYFGLAKISDSNTMPAIGMAIANIASGSIGIFQYQGRMTNPNWDFSGYVGKLLFLGSEQCESEVTRTAPSASGECVQRVAKVVSKDTVFVRPELIFIQIAE